MAKKANTTHAAGRKTPGELFDLNVVTLTGRVIGLWGRNGNVFARLQIQSQLPLPTPDCFANVSILNGEINGNPVTLQKGDLLQVTGYVRQTQFSETLRNFLDNAGRANFVDEVVPEEDRAAWRDLSIRRRNAMVEAIGITKLPEIKTPINTIDLEGVVVETWHYSREQGGTDIFARLAIYDENCPLSNEKGNWGRMKRKAHYINVLFPDGKPLSANTPVNIKRKQKVRVRGELRDKWTPVDLHQVLIETGSSKVIELMSRVPKNDLHAIKTSQEHLHVLVNAAVLYSK